MRTGPEAIAALRALPCGAALDRALGSAAGVWVVGGAVRDALLGRVPSEIDIAVQGDPVAVAAALGVDPAASHERFGTLRVDAGAWSFDIARTRTETYSAPGALPDVMPGTLADDLGRRDLTVNAIALSAGGELVAAPRALDDLAAGLLRVLHPRSFHDDPTRLWRLARYAARLGFVAEPETLCLAREAVAAGALATVSGDRIGNEIRLALRGDDPAGAVQAAVDLGLTGALRSDAALVAKTLELLPDDARRDLAALGAMLEAADPRRWLDDHGFPAVDRRVVERAVALAPVSGGRPSEVASALRGEPVEAVAVAGARGDAAAARRWLEEWRHVSLEIGGEDLLAAGVERGPEIGRRLARVLELRLDGELAPGRDAELAAALRETGGSGT